MTKRVELLAPCGSYESFLAAVNAGADAVYLGGRQFGARAYAENFSEDELVTVIKQAHLFGVKVYLTVNTLVKEQEFSGLYDYLHPLYEAGLDGVIVQDMGVFCFLKQQFPGLKLHASTQMTITGAYGAAYLKEMGCERIVPARELSLQEIKTIKQRVCIEIEAFIHGAMCYCYSGQCLMSSMIGGRSGNRGRCAGPCRLPYRVSGREGYYLSLKDMNTLSHIPELIETGIDSFKIEGRMKRPEYVAGVVSVYRKYIDRYYSGANEPANSKGFYIEPKDEKMLSDLYIRSETGSGYYEKRNGRDMLTLQKPGYNEADQALVTKLRERYIHELPKTEIQFFVRCREAEPLYGEVRFTDRASEKEVCLSISGAVAEKADKRAVSEAEIRDQLLKTGGTPFAVKECTVEVGENIFVPMSRIKALRRELLQKIYEYYGARKLKESTGVMASDHEEGERTAEINVPVRNDNTESDYTETTVQGIPEPGMDGNRNIEAEERKKGISEKKNLSLTILVQTKEQFEAVFSTMSSSVANFSDPEEAETEEKAAETIAEYLIVDADLLLEEGEIQDRLFAGKVRWGLRCPVILRKSDEEFLQRLRNVIEERKPEIVYCATIDVFAWVKSISYAGKIAGEASLYAWNREAVSFWGRELERVSIPLELDSKEIRELCGAVEDVDQNSQKSRGYQTTERMKELSARLETPVYGRAPFMVSANCIKLSAGECDRNRRQYTELTDRLGNTFPVYTNCRHCYNIIYNCMPTSYYDGLWMLLQDGIRAFRVEFTTESGRSAAQIMQTFRTFFASELTEEDAGRMTAKRDKRNHADKGMTEQKKGKTAGVATTQGRFRRSVE